MSSIQADDSSQSVPVSSAGSSAAPPSPRKEAKKPTTSLPVRRAGAPREPVASPPPPQPEPPRLPTRAARKPAPNSTKTPAVVETVDVLPKVALLMALLFVGGILLIAAGVSVMRSADRFNFISIEQGRSLREYVENYQEVIVGMAVLLAGAIIAGLAARNVLADKLAGLPLPLPTPSFDRIAAGSAALGAIITLVLWVRQTTGQYNHIDIVFFFAGLLFFGVAVWRLDRHERPGTLRLTRYDFLAALGLAIASGIINSIDLTRWNFAWIGDEGAFYGEARTYAEGNPWNFFNLSAVYQTHPALDSVYQALVMKIFGVNVFGWRFSEVIVLAAATALIYFLGTTLFGRLQGGVAAIVLGASHYLMAFTRIAYNNTHIIFYAILVMLMLALAWRTQRAIFVYALGLAMGFCLYTFQAAILTWPIVAILLLLIFFRKPSWGQVAAGMLMIFAFLLVVTPGLLTTPLDHLIQVAIQNSRREVALTNPDLVVRVSLVQSTLVWWVNDQWHHHYVGGPLVDSITGLFLAAGLFIALFRVNKRGERLALLWFVFGLIMLSISNYVPGPSLTRLLFLLPAVALLVGLAVAKLERILRSSIKLPLMAARALVVVPLLVVVPALNLQQLLVDSPNSVLVTQQVMAMKAVQEHPDYVIVEVGKTLDFNTIEMMRIYPWLTQYYRYVNVGELEQPYREGPANNLPIFMVDQRSADIVQQVSEKLPAYYKLTTDYGPLNSYKTWLFIPDPNATVALPQSEGPGFGNPQRSVEIKLDRRADGKPAETRDVAVDSAGNIFVITDVENVIRKYDPNGQLLASWGNTAPDSGPFQELFAIAIGADDTIYALDSSAGMILHFSNSGADLGNPIKEIGYYPRGLSVTPDGELLVSNTGGGQILRFSADGRKLGEIGQVGSEPGQFSEPTDAVQSPKGDIYVLDARNSRIQHLSLSGSVLKTWSIAGVENARDSGHIALDTHGRLFVTAPSTHEVVVYNADGQTIARLPQTDIDAAPAGIFVDSSDNFYVTYPDADVVRKYSLQ